MLLLIKRDSDSDCVMSDAYQSYGKDLLPFKDNKSSIGSTSKRWKSVYGVDVSAKTMSLDGRDVGSDLTRLRTAVPVTLFFGPRNTTYTFDQVMTIPLAQHKSLVDAVVELRVDIMYTWPTQRKAPRFRLKISQRPSPQTEEKEEPLHLCYCGVYDSPGHTNYLDRSMRVILKQGHELVIQLQKSSDENPTIEITQGSFITLSSVN